jgi:UDPglucose--hexose-1-phosphate uridylyltransferase
MSELRQNLISRDWVIIATERAKRPDQFVKSDKDKKELPVYQPNCPFCPGNEKQAPPETYRVGDDKSWRVRVVPNKFAALAPEGEKIRKLEGIQRSMSGVGYHEVIVEHQKHNITTALLSVKEVEDIIKAYKERYKAVKQDKRVESIIIFKNHGEAAGTSLEHPHSQLVATPVVPTQIRQRMEEAIRYFDDTGECVFCHTLRDELKTKERIVMETEHFAAFIPYAALSPFHIWIQPRRHSSCFDDITDNEMADMAKILKTILAKLYHGLNNPDFNYTIRSIQTKLCQTEYFHWYISIIPRLSKAAGFELGSGMFISTALPEACAKFLREVKTP